MYSFDGHGLSSGGYLGAGEFFYNTYSTAYPTNTYFNTNTGMKSTTNVYLADLPSANVSGLLLAVNVGCGTAATHPTLGNFAKRMNTKGADCSIGFYQALEARQADYWYRRFFYWASKGYSFSNSCTKAITDTYNYYGSYGGVASVMVYGDGSLKLAPARYGS